MRQVLLDARIWRWKGRGRSGFQTSLALPMRSAKSAAFSTFVVYDVIMTFFFFDWLSG